MRIKFSLVDENKLWVTAENKKIFKHPKISLAVNKYISQFEGYYDEDKFIFTANIESLSELYFDLRKKFSSLGHDVVLDDNLNNQVSQKENEENFFLNACIKAKNVWEGKIETEEFHHFSQHIQNNFNHHEKLTRRQLLSAFHLASISSACNFSVPGAGKTTIVLAAYSYLNALPKSDSRYVDCMFVVGPISCFDAWERDFKFWFLKDLKSIRFQSSVDKIQKERIVKGIDLTHKDDDLHLAHFATFSYNQELFKYLFNRRRVMFVIDEAHYIKAEDGVWSNAALNMAKLAKSRVILTGTPAAQGYEDLKNLFDFIHPDRNIIGFNRAQLKQMTQTVMSSENLHDKIKPFFTNIKKSDLGLPEPEFTHLKIPMSSLQQKIYNQIEYRFAKSYKELAAQNKFSKKLFKNANLIRLRQAASNPVQLLQPLEDELIKDDNLEDVQMVKAIQSISEDILKFENEKDLEKLKSLAHEIKKSISNSERVLIWSYSVKNVTLISDYLKRTFPEIEVFCVTGSTPVEVNQSVDSEELELTRVATINKFRQSPSAVLIATAQCIGESISLHKECHKAIYFDRDFDCGRFIQSKNRIDRYDKNPIQAKFVFLSSKDTVDERIHNALEEKEKRMEKIIDKEDIPMFYEDAENDYINNIEAIVKAYELRQL
jgi:SNF2 domain-containing protein